MSLSFQVTRKDFWTGTGKLAGYRPGPGGYGFEPYAEEWELEEYGELVPINFCDGETKWIHKQRYEELSPLCYTFFNALNEYNHRKHYGLDGYEEFETMGDGDFHGLWAAAEGPTLSDNTNENVMLALAHFPTGGRYVKTKDLHNETECKDSERNILLAGLRREVHDRKLSDYMEDIEWWSNGDRWDPFTTFSYDDDEEFVPLWNELSKIISNDKKSQAI
tara:strand:- start:16 stop:675 length:660 start_codon:yes stop_codon:yes gene_type:complete